MLSETHSDGRFVLRDYQARGIEKLRAAYRAGANGIFLVAPTGSGKTVIFSQVAAYAEASGKRVLILAHRRELIAQASEKLTAFGVQHGIIQASNTTNPHAHVQVASVQTLRTRDAGFTPGLIIVDEAHLATAKSYEAVYKRYPEAKRLFVSATPRRLDGKGFEKWCDHLIELATVDELIAQGHLVPLRYFSESPPSGLDTVRVKGGDFEQDELGRLCNTRRVRGDILEHWTRYAQGRQTIVFAVTREHSKALAQDFQSAGIIARHLDGDTPAKERKCTVEAFKAGQIQVLTNVGLFTEGFDSPATACIVLARPTKSLTLYLQMVGRGTRPDTGKTDLLVLDHGGNLNRHGPIEAGHEWYLESDATRRKAKAKKQEDSGLCTQCLKPMPKGNRVCRHCGHEQIALNPIRVETQDGQLREILPGTLGFRVRTEYHRLREVALRRRTLKGRPYHPDWAFHQLLETFSFEAVIRALGTKYVPFSLRERLRG